MIITNGIRIPSAYQAGYARAREVNPELAARYIEHTTMDDPVADAVIEALAPFDHGQVHRFIKAGMERDEKSLAEAPQLLRDFFADIEPRPAWFDPSAVLSGCTALSQILGPVNSRLLCRHLAERLDPDCQGVLRHGPSREWVWPPTNPAEYPALHRDHAPRRPRTLRRRLEAVRPYPAGTRAGPAVDPCLGQLGRVGLWCTAQARRICRWRRPISRPRCYDMRKASAQSWTTRCARALCKSGAMLRA